MFPGASHALRRKSQNKAKTSLYGILAQMIEFRNSETHVNLHKNKKKSWIFCRFTKNKKRVLL